MQIRSAGPEDIVGIRAVNLAAFETDAEARLVEALQAKVAHRVSLVAHDGAAVVGHALFTPVTLGDDGDLSVAGLAPLAVLPAHQRRGIGGALVREGLAECRRVGFVAVVVLGHPAFAELGC